MIKLNFEQQARANKVYKAMIEGDNLQLYANEITYLRDDNQKLQEYSKKCNCCCCPHGVDHGH